MKNTQLFETIHILSEFRSLEYAVKKELKSVENCLE